MPSQLFHKPFTIHVSILHGNYGCKKLIMTTPKPVTELFLTFMIIMSFPSFLFWTTTTINSSLFWYHQHSPEDRDPVPLSVLHMPVCISFGFFDEGWGQYSLFTHYCLHALQMIICLKKCYFPKLRDDLVILRKSAFSSLVSFILCFHLKIHKLAT